MNEVKLSTQVKSPKSSRLSIKLDLKKMGLDWQNKDVIRVMSYKEDGTLILKKVGKKSDKTVAHTLTKTGGGNFGHGLGIYVPHKQTRFKKKFKQVSNISAGVRFMNEKKTIIQIYLPREIFEDKKLAV